MAVRTAVLIDRDQLFAAALQALTEHEEVRLGGSCINITEAKAWIAAHGPPDIVLLDPAGLDHPLPEVVSEIRRLAPDAAAVLISSDLSASMMQACLDAGADAHLGKSASLATVLHALRLVAQRQAIFPAPAARSIAAFTLPDLEGDDVATTAADLSPREIQILACLLAGHSNKTIARNLQITESTVKMHFKNLMRKINASNRTQAAVWAIQHGITPVT